MGDKRECEVFRSVEDDQLPEESAVASGGGNQPLPGDPPDSLDTEDVRLKDRILERLAASYGAAEKRVREGD